MNKFSSALIVFQLLVGTAALHSQKSNVLGAYKYLQVYKSSLKCGELKAAKEAVDLAVNDIQTAQWAKTWKYKGDIYFEIAISEDNSCASLADTALSASYAAYKKAMELDVKKFYPTEIQTKLAVVGPYFLRYGVNAYNENNYRKALGYFQKSMEIATVFKKVDSLAIYNAALSAEQLKKYELAQNYYLELTKVKYGGAKIYSFLANSYLKQGDSTQVLSAILAGRNAYPDDKELVKEELNFYLDHHKYDAALTTLNFVLADEPKNPVYLFYKGTVLDNRGEYDQAEEVYKRCLASKPDYFDANFNLGALYYNLGLEKSEAAYMNGVNEKLLEEARDYFKKALPYLEKAHQLDNYDQSTMISLQKIHSILENDEEYERITNELNN